jgi:lipoprotein-releasing system ATP-binding protein
VSRDLVIVESVTKRFMHEGNELLVLRGVDLRIEQGEMVCVVGPSGAGKSTLLHLLGTLDLPTSGRILYDGNDVTRLGSARLADFRNRSIGFVFQFHHLLPEFTALENVMMPGLIRGEPRERIRKRAQTLLEEVGLGPRVTHRPGELSGGEQQRVALARALVMEPRLVLADEPTGNLDSKTSDAIHELFFELNRKRETTFLIVTHSRDLAARMPRVVTMRDGLIERDERQEPLPYRSVEAPRPDEAPPEEEPAGAGGEPEEEPPPDPAELDRP